MVELAIMKTAPPPTTSASDGGPELSETDTAAPLAAGAPAVRARRFQPPVALQHRDFTLLWGGQAVSQIGTQMQVVATAWLLWELTHSALALGLVGLFRFVPLMLFALFGGVIADAFDRRALLLITQTILMSLSVVLGFATGAGVVAPWLIYAFVTAASVANAFDNPARSALVPNLVPREHLTNALSLSNINFQLGTIVGPALAGLLLALFHSASVVYWFDALSYFAVLAALLLIRTRLPAMSARQVNFGAALDGLRFVRRSPIMASTMSLDFFATFLGVSPLLLPIFADKVLHVNADGLGLLFAAEAVGAVITSVIMSFVRHVERQGRVVLISIAIYGLAGVVVGLSTTYWLTWAALAVIGAADTVSMVMRQTIRQLVTPDELRGRMTSVNMVFFMGGPQLGNLESGALAQAIGVGPATAISAAGVLVVVGLTTAFVGRLREYRASQSAA
jgi:MFS family permease